MKTLLPLLLLAGGFRQDPPAATAPSDIEATLVDFSGTVDVLRPGDKDWIPAEKNLKLKQGSEICTGTSSAATVLFPGSLTIDLKAVTYATIADLLKFSGGLKTNLRLKFGSVDIDLKKSEVTAGLTVATPNATTSISGSKGSVTAWAQGGQQFISLKVYSGKWSFHSGKNGFDDVFGPGGYTNDLGDLSFDIDAFHEIHQYGLNPGFQGGFNGLNPFLDAVTQPSTLPGPPPPP